MAPNICRKSDEDLHVQVWGNWGKNPLHPQKCSYTYALNQNKIQI